MDALINDILNILFHIFFICSLIIIIFPIVIFFFNLSHEDKIGKKNIKNAIRYFFSKKGLLQLLTIFSFIAIGAANIFIVKIAFALLFVVFLLFYMIEGWKEEK
ncbi:MAG: hypothetical protein LUG19_13220 [Desulfovibrio sp.]|uniref:hypothetical protein n=1 Tax=Desulfovibrio sp. TaxID=885 RepID=UPI002589026D|nr:hypothetical protein [Desulfovibrio sp.]MCD7985188.1 hypothetical protein [Desulfovibrio sp.]